MRALDFTTFLQRALMAVFTVALLIVAACSDDEPVTPVTVEFNTPTSRSVDESFGDDIVINVKLSGAAKKAGTLTVSATSTVGSANDHVTFDDEIAIDKGNTAAQFVVNLKDNQAIDGAKTITFTLADPSSGFELGTAKTYTLVINDDEGPTTANFAVGSASIGEGSTTGVVVTINLTPAATTAGTVQITIDPTTAPVTTTPAATAGVVTVTVPDNATTVSFTVIPTDNETPNESVEVGFEITGSSGGVQIGALKDYALTITDDDAIEPVTIASIRALYSTADVVIPAETYIQGIVVSNNNNLTNRNIFIQDETGSIALKFAAVHTFTQGQELMINVGGITVTRLLHSSGTDVNLGPLLIGTFSAGVPLENVEPVGTGELPAAEVITLTQLNAGTFEGKLVSIASVSFPDADGILTLQGSRDITDGTVEGVVRTENYTTATWRNTPMPLGSGVVRGIASSFNGTSQVIPMVASDIFENSPTGSIGITQTLVDFGSVNNGAESAEQSYIVQGTTLTNDIVITASAGYKVSLVQAGPYESTATILAATANSATTVYVKFLPTTGVNGVKGGSLTHTSQGVATVDFDVTGTESGNAETSLLLNETFDYTAAEGTDMIVASAGAWAISTGNAVKVTFSTTPLSLTDYPGSNVGGAATIAGNGEDINRAFSEQTSGVVYSAFLTNVSSATTGGDYFYHFKNSASGFSGRVFAKDNGSGGLQFGVQKTSGTGAGTTYSTTTYAYNTTYLVVVKYDFTAQSASIYVLNAVTSTEPATADAVESGSSTAVTSIVAVAIRQTSTTPSAKIDAIRVATVWADLFN